MEMPAAGAARHHMYRRTSLLGHGIPVMASFPPMQNTFVLTLLLLEAGGNFSDEGRHVLFSATSSLMTFVLMVRTLH
jgi:hypothetical protein